MSDIDGFIPIVATWFDEEDHDEPAHIALRVVGETTVELRGDEFPDGETLTIALDTLLTAIGLAMFGREGATEPRVMLEALE